MNQHYAIFLPSLGGGGAERVMVTLANGLAARGHRVDLVLATAEGPYLSEVSASVRVFDLRVKRVLASIIPLARYLRRERPHVMLTALTHANLVALVARDLSGTGTRLVISERDSLTSLDGHWKGTIILELMRRFYPRADAVSAVSQALVKELQERLPLRHIPVASTPNPVNIEQIRSLTTKRPDHPWFRAGEPPVILAVGRLVEQKDFPTLLKAFASVVQRRDIRLIILGEGRQRAELEQLAVDLGVRTRTLMPGFQPNPYSWMAAAKLYVSTSRHEGFPNSLVQAMACGTPVVSTNCPTGPEEILKSGKWGRLVGVGDVEGLTAAIESSLDTGPLPVPEISLAEYHPDTVLESYLELLNEPAPDRRTLSRVAPGNLAPSLQDTSAPVFRSGNGPSAKLRSPE